MEQQLSTPAKGVSLEETGMLEIVSGLVGGLLASAAGALAAFALLAGLRRVSHMQLPTPMRHASGRPARSGAPRARRRESKRPA